MTQEQKICRFCLSSKNVSINPLISPCNCKGSLEFVHLKCLNRWRRMDIQRNARLCSLCLTNYRFLDAMQMEEIPETHTIPIYFLTYPGIILLLYNYIYSIVLSSSRNPNYDFLQQYYVVSQYSFHFLYFILLYTEWNVFNKDLYWKQLKTVWTPIIVGTHTYMLVLLTNDAYLLGPILSFYMGLYWSTHKRLLQNINAQLTNLQQE